MKLIPYTETYGYMSEEARRKILPQRNVCSIRPSKDRQDYFYTGNGSHRIDMACHPYEEEIIVTQELLYEPQWKDTPLPPDLRPYLTDIRKYLREGKTDLVDQLIEKAQREAGLDKYMDLNKDIVYPIGSLSIHKAFSLKLVSEERKTKNYLRWLDILNGSITTHWENELGIYESKVIASYKDDIVAIQYKAPKEALELSLKIELPGGPNMWGQPTMIGAKHTLTHEDGLYTISWAYNPEFGKKGYISFIRIVPQGGTITYGEENVDIAGADSLLILAKAIRVEENFEPGCVNEYKSEILNVSTDFDELILENQHKIGERMRRSQIILGDPEDQYLSGEELLARCHSDKELDPTLMDKLYDMGRFYQIIDTGKLPPMWGQHNINTNLQVCAGNNTGLFEEMDTYFRYYETKFDDFRTNAKLLFGARGLLASIHCDYNSGLFYQFSKTYPHYCWTGCLGWIYNELWGYYLCTGDQNFLKKRVVPALKEIALFFEDYACDHDDNGKVIFYPSFSPEDPTPNPDYSTVTCKSKSATRINSVMDIAICREVLLNLMTACKELGIEEEMISHWEKQLEDLPDYLLDSEGGLKEWAWADIEENYNHRHVSHHYDLWPGRAVTLETEPELARAIKISNRKRGQQDDSAHGIIHRAFCAIRLKDVEELEQNLTQLINHGFVRSGLSTNHFPYRMQFPDLQGAMPALLLEMCIFSAPGVIEFLPAMPDSFETGRLEGVWLYTWIKLSYMEWTKSAIHAKLTSQREQNITIQCRRPDCSFFVDGVKVEKGKDCIQYTMPKDKEVDIEIKYSNFVLGGNF